MSKTRFLRRVTNGIILLMLIILVWQQKYSNIEVMSYLTMTMWVMMGIVLLAVFLFLFSKIRDRKLLKTVTKSNRGTRTERKLVLKLLKFGIPAQDIFHDLYLKKPKGDFSQIDVVAVTKLGIIVFEVKELSGWIYGNGHYTQWTKVLAYGKKKYRFYNPILQNNKHIADLRKQLREKIPYYSIVVFYGDCELKEINYVPSGTFLVKAKRVKEVMKLIRKQNPQVLYADKNEVIRVLREAVQNGENRETQLQHVENIKDLLGKDRIFG